jgi:hypothetical protein
MRGVSLLIAYLIALGAIISFGAAGLMALQSPEPRPATPETAIAPYNERAAKTIRQPVQKNAQSNQKRKTANTMPKRLEGAPNSPSSGRDAYGSASEPHHLYLNPFRFFGR